MSFVIGGREILVGGMAWDYLDVSSGAIEVSLLYSTIVCRSPFPNLSEKIALPYSKESKAICHVSRSSCIHPADCHLVSPNCTHVSLKCPHVISRISHRYVITQWQLICPCVFLERQANKNTGIFQAGRQYVMSSRVVCLVAAQDILRATGIE